jgi:hypothetical protein
MPETGSLRDRITTSTRACWSSLKASSFLTSENATPGRAGCVHALQLQLHVGAVVTVFEDAVLFFKVEQRARRDGHDKLAVQALVGMVGGW